MTDITAGARIALQEADRLYDRILANGRQPPIWFIEYRVQLRLVAKLGGEMPAPREPLSAHSFGLAIH